MAGPVPGPGPAICDHIVSIGGKKVQKQTKTNKRI